MRVLFVSEATGWSGGANQVWLTSRELTRRGAAVAVACAAGGELGRRLAESGVRVLDFPIARELDPPAARRLKRLAQAFGTEIVHAHHPRAHATCLVAGWLPGGAFPPLVVTRRVIYPVGGNPLSAFKYRSRRVARYIAVCRAAGFELERAGVEPSRIEVIPSAVELERWEEAGRARAAGPTSAFVVTAVGHVGPTKGQDVLLRAASRVLQQAPEAEFRLVGRGTEGLAPLVRSLGLGERVKLLGERRDVPSLLAETSVFAMPSLMEGIGTALIEAQAAGVPAVASDVGGLPDVVEGGVTGLLVPPGDDLALAEALLTLRRDPALGQEMAARGRERVRGRFCLESVVDRLVALYASLGARSLRN